MVTNKLGYNAESVGTILRTFHFQNFCPPSLPKVKKVKQSR